MCSLLSGELFLYVFISAKVTKFQVSIKTPKTPEATLPLEQLIGRVMSGQQVFGQACRKKIRFIPRGMEENYLIALVSRELFLEL